MNFIEYLGVEEQNLLASTVNFRSEFDLFYSLDKIYQNPVNRLNVVPEGKSLIPQLYYLVHFHLYFSFSCLLRSHLSESISSTRKAIDAALSAYKIILEPNTAEKYINRDKYFQNIKGKMQKEIKDESSKYPLAQSLIKIHEFCSEYGSHADISSFFHRIEEKGNPSAKTYELFVHYFQFPRKEEEFKFYVISTLQAFYLMFKIFKKFFDDNLKIKDLEWENDITTIGPKLDELRQRHHSRIGNNS